MAMNQSCHALVAKDDEVSAYFLFFSIFEGVNQFKQRVTGAVDAITVDTFKQMDLIRPPKEADCLFHKR